MKRKAKGFSLLEMLLVIAIVSSLVVLMLNYTTQKAEEMRRVKTALQVQQILNTSLSFYVNTSYWPIKNATITAPGCGTTTWTDLTASQLPNNYIPSTLTINSYTQPFMINCSSTGVFYVTTTANSTVNAQIIAGKLPIGFVTDATGAAKNPPTQSAACQSATPGSGCKVVVSSVVIPGQNLNNARSVNFAGVYYSGSCVPAPTCPPGMKASIIVAPSSVTGINEQPTCGPIGGNSPYDPVDCTANIYPVSSFTAFARGASVASSLSATPIDPVDPNSPGPYDCSVQDTPKQLACWASYANGVGTPFPNNSGVKYWRVCLTITTEKGLIAPVNLTPYTQHGKMMGTVIVFTRCIPNSGTENPGGSVDVFQQNTGFNR